MKFHVDDDVLFGDHRVDVRGQTNARSDKMQVFGMNCLLNLRRPYDLIVDGPMASLKYVIILLLLIFRWKFEDRILLTPMEDCSFVRQPESVNPQSKGKIQHSPCIPAVSEQIRCVITSRFAIHLYSSTFHVQSRHIFCFTLILFSLLAFHLIFIQMDVARSSDNE